MSLSQKFPSEMLSLPASVVSRFVREAVVSDVVKQLAHLEAYPPRKNVPAHELFHESTMAAFLPVHGDKRCVCDAIVESDNFDRGLREHLLRYCLGVSVLMATSAGKYVDVDVLRLKQPTGTADEPCSTLGWLMCVTPGKAMREERIIHRTRTRDTGVVLLDDAEDDEDTGGGADEDTTGGVNGGASAPAQKKAKRVIKRPVRLHEEMDACMKMLDIAYASAHEIKQTKAAQNASDHVFRMHQGRASRDRVVLEQQGGKWALDITDAVCESRFRSNVADMPLLMPGMYERNAHEPDSSWELIDLYFMGNVMRLAGAFVPELRDHPLAKAHHVRNFTIEGQSGSIHFESVDWYAFRRVAGGTIADSFGFARMLLPSSDVYPTLEQVAGVMNRLMNRLPPVVKALVGNAERRVRDMREAAERAQEVAELQAAGEDVPDELLVTPGEQGPQGTGDGGHPAVRHTDVVVSAGIASEFPTTRPEFMAVACHMAGYSRPSNTDAWSTEDWRVFRAARRTLQRREVYTLESIGSVTKMLTDREAANYPERLAKVMQPVGGHTDCNMHDALIHLQNVRRMFIMMRPQQQDVPPRLLVLLGMLNRALPGAVGRSYELMDQNFKRSVIETVEGEGTASLADIMLESGDVMAGAHEVMGALRAHMGDARTNPFAASNAGVEDVMRYAHEGANVRGPLRDALACILLTMHRVTQTGLAPTEVLMGKTGGGKSTIQDVLDAVFSGMRTSGTMTLAYMRSLLECFTLIFFDELPVSVCIDGKGKDGPDTTANESRHALLQMLDGRMQQYNTAYSGNNPDPMTAEYRPGIFTANSQKIDEAFKRRAMVHPVGTMICFTSYETSEVDAKADLGKVKETSGNRIDNMRFVMLLSALLQLGINTGVLQRGHGLQNTDACSMAVAAMSRHYRHTDARVIHAGMKLEKAADLMAFQRAVSTALERFVTDEQVMQSFGVCVDVMHTPVQRIQKLAEVWSGATNAASRESVQTAVMAIAAPLTGTTIADIMRAAVMCEVGLYPLHVVKYIGILRSEVVVDRERMRLGDPSPQTETGLVMPILVHAGMFLITKRDDNRLTPTMILSRFMRHERMQYDRFTAQDVSAELETFMADSTASMGDSREANVLTPLTLPGLKTRVLGGHSEQEQVRSRVREIRQRRTEPSAFLPTPDQALREGQARHPLSRPVFFTCRTDAEFAVMAGLDGNELLPSHEERVACTAAAQDGNWPYDRLSPDRFVLDDVVPGPGGVVTPDEDLIRDMMDIDPPKSGGDANADPNRDTKPKRATFGMGAGIPTECLAHFRSGDAADLLASLFMVCSLVRADQLQQCFWPWAHTHVLCNMFFGRAIVSGYGRDVIPNIADAHADDAVLYIPLSDVSSMTHVIHNVDPGVVNTEKRPREVQTIVSTEAVDTLRQEGMDPAEARVVAREIRKTRPGATYHGAAVPGTVAQAFMRIPLAVYRRTEARWKNMHDNMDPKAEPLHALRACVRACRVVVVVGETAGDGNEDEAVDDSEPVAAEDSVLRSRVERPMMGPVVQIANSACFVNVAALHQTSLSINDKLQQTFARTPQLYGFLLHDIMASAHRYHTRIVDGNMVLRTMAAYNVLEAKVFASWAERTTTQAVLGGRPVNGDAQGGQRRHPVGTTAANTWYCMAPAGASFLFSSMYPHSVRCLLGMAKATPTEAELTLSLPASDPWRLHTCMRVLVPAKPWQNDWVKLWSMEWTCKVTSPITVQPGLFRKRALASRMRIHGLHDIPALEKDDEWDPVLADRVNDLRYGASGPVGVACTSLTPARNVFDGDVLQSIVDGKPVLDTVTGNIETHFVVHSAPDTDMAGAHVDAEAMQRPYEPDTMESLADVLRSAALDEQYDRDDEDEGITEVAPPGGLGWQEDTVSDDDEDSLPAIDSDIGIDGGRDGDSDDEDNDSNAGSSSSSGQRRRGGYAPCTDAPSFATSFEEDKSW